jgi:hypothetical protein
MRLERDAFELSELAERWGITAADVRYLVAEGRMRLSVRIVAQPVLISEEELTAEGEPFWIPAEESMFTGLADLALRDAFRLVRDGAARVTHLHLPGHRMVTLRGGDGIEFTQIDLLVRSAHAEALQGEVIGAPLERGEAFDFRLFVFDGEEFAFTIPQARALAFMLEQTRAGAPDQHHLQILKAAQSSSTKLGNLFSRKPLWTRLLRKTAGRRGWYHLDPDFVIWLVTQG